MAEFTGKIYELLAKMQVSKCSVTGNSFFLRAKRKEIVIND
jgi:hypothetical protein